MAAVESRGRRPIMREFEPTEHAHLFAAVIREQQGLEVPFAGADVSPTSEGHLSPGDWPLEVSLISPGPFDGEGGLVLSLPSSPSEAFECPDRSPLPSHAGRRASFDQCREGGAPPLYLAQDPFKPRRASFDEPRNNQMQHFPRSTHEYSTAHQQRHASPFSAETLGAQTVMPNPVNLAPLYSSPSRTSSISTTDSRALENSPTVGWLGLPLISSPSSSTSSGLRNLNALQGQPDRSPFFPLATGAKPRSTGPGTQQSRIQTPLYSSFRARHLQPSVPEERALVQQNGPDLYSAEERVLGVCINFEDSEEWCQDKELDKDRLEGVSICPLFCHSNAPQDSSEPVLYALYFTTTGDVPQLPGSEATRRLFPKEMQQRARGEQLRKNRQMQGGGTLLFSGLN